MSEYGSAWPHPVAPSSAATGQHGTEIVYTTTRPTRAKVTVRYCTHWSVGNGAYTSSLTVVGHTTITPTTKDEFCFDYPHSQTLDALIDANGLTFRFDTGGSCHGDWGPGGQGSFSGRWRIEVVPDPNFPCTPTAYGAACGGAALTTSTDFDGPGTHLLRLQDPQPMVIALMAFGDQRASLLFPPDCTLLNNLVFAVQAPINGNIAALRVRPPAIPGLVFQVQGVVGFADFTLHLSNGIEFACP